MQDDDVRVQSRMFGPTMLQRPNLLDTRTPTSNGPADRLVKRELALEKQEREREMERLKEREKEREKEKAKEKEKAAEKEAKTETA